MPVMNRDDRDPGRVQLTVTQVLAGALAAMVGSLVASRLGVAGTVIGAAVISVVATVLTAINVNSMTHVKERAREARLTSARARLQGARGTDQAGDPGQEAGTAPSRSSGPVNAEVSDQQAALWEIAEIEAEEAQEATEEHGRFTVADRRGYHWGVIAGVSVLVFVLAMVGITVVEKITGQAIACSFGRDCDDRTTIPLPGRNPTPTPTPSPSVEPTPSQSATVEPTPSQTPTPSPSVTTSPEPSPSESVSPGVENPSPTPGATAS